jgi:hypothetical protein
MVFVALDATCVHTYVCIRWYLLLPYRLLSPRYRGDAYGRYYGVRPCAQRLRVPPLFAQLCTPRNGGAADCVPVPFDSMNVIPLSLIAHNSNVNVTFKFKDDVCNAELRIVCFLRVKAILL